MEHMTRAEARRRASTPPIVVRESQTPEQRERYLAALEAAIDDLRGWAAKYAHLIDDTNALRELDDIVASSAERHLARHERAVRSETLTSVSEMLRAIADRGGSIPHVEIEPRP